jgi:hypothetical protein
LASFPTRLLGAADRLAGALGIFDRPLRGEELLRIAERRTGLTDFGDRSFEEPLEVLLRDYERAADLSLFGRIAARWDMLRFLSNLLRLRERERRCPEILQQPIVKPIFITGMPRSGSSFLHNLLAQDSSIFAPLCWETIHPCRLPGEADGDPSRRQRMAGRTLSGFNWVAPELGALHPLGAHATQECSEISAHVFKSRRFETTHRLPDYRVWLERAGDLSAYRFHKRFLQHLQHRRGRGRWIVKCPEHIFSLDSIRAVYPDASFVFMHRDPLEVLPSLAKLTEVLRRPFTRSIDRFQIGRQVSDNWARGVDLLVEADAKSQGSGHQILNIQYRRFVQQPLATALALFGHFGVPISEEATGRLERFIAGRRNGGYGRNRYRPEEFGLDPQAIARRFGDYVARFAIKGEGGTGGAGERRHALILDPATLLANRAT